MMSHSLSFLLGLMLFATSGADRTPTEALECTYPDDPYSQRSVATCVVTACEEAIRKHVQHELNAAFSYLYMAAYFDDVSVSRPGLAKFLYESASEERAHAIAMLEYLDRRGVPVSQRVFNNEADYSFQLQPEEGSGSFPFYKGVNGKYSYQDALEIALKMEMEVTKRITGVVSACSDDYDGADFFTQPILAEQFDGQRKLTGAISMLSDMIGGQSDQSAFAEYVFDQRVLKSGL